ncbi:MAG: hypothetical protein DRN27_07280 [Thermoplasmata archaeon]|nr:MAG: hypothetical protein DRN27_07280 [Thermoplasmata archaeon]
MNKIITLTLLLILILPSINLMTTAKQNETYDYVIITTNKIESDSHKLDDFIQHKEKLGFEVLVITEDDFEHLEGPYPNKRADKIRQWLVDNYYEMDIEYVLLIGDPTPDGISQYSIPMKMFSDRFLGGILNFMTERDSPSDYYYADLDSNWNRIAKGYCGDYLDYKEGDINADPEVFVGRIPVYNGNMGELDHILQKTIDYENEEDTSWRKNALFAASFSIIPFDNAQVCEQIIDDLFPSDFSYWRLYQQGSFLSELDSIFESEEELRDGRLTRRWQNDTYGIVTLMGHGTSRWIGIGINLARAAYVSDGYIITSKQTESLSNDYPSFVFLNSCNNGLPEQQENLGYSLLKNGGIAVLCATRTIYYMRQYNYGDFDESFESSGLFYRIIHKTIQNNPIGRALYVGSAEINDMMFLDDSDGHYTYFKNLLRLNLYGDPSLHLFPE